jgi:lipid-A-disaccharide synthase
MIVVYRTSPLTYLVGRRLVKVPHLGMVNIVAGRELCPEFIQGEARPVAMAAAVEPLLRDTPERGAMLDGLAAVRTTLGEGGAAERAADLFLDELEAPRN